MSKTSSVALADSSSEPTTTATQPERWLFIDGAPAFGGHEVMLLRWLEELAAQRSVSAFVMARRGSQLKREAVRHAVIVELPPPATGKLQQLIGIVRDAAAVIRAAWTLRPNVCVIAEGCLLSQPFFALFARLAGMRTLVYVPLVQTSVSMSFGNGRIRDAIVRRFYSKLPHGWITITQHQATDFRHWAGIKRPILTLPNTVSRNIETAALARVDDDERPTDSPLRIVVLGRLEPHQKGLDLLLDYIVSHPELGDTLRLAFVGSGPFEAAIRARLTSDPNFARWVSIHPWSPTEEVMQKSDVLLMTSRYEGVPLVILEAMALGVPVVAPDLDGTRAFVAADCLFAPGDISAAFVIIARLRDPQMRRELIARNRATFQATASNASFAAAVKALTPQIRELGRTPRRQRSA